MSKSITWIPPIFCFNFAPILPKLLHWNNGGGGGGRAVPACPPPPPPPPSPSHTPMRKLHHVSIALASASKSKWTVRDHWIFIRLWVKTCTCSNVHKTCRCQTSCKTKVWFFNPFWTSWCKPVANMRVRNLLTHQVISVNTNLDHFSMDHLT